MKELRALVKDKKHEEKNDVKPNTINISGKVVLDLDFSKKEMRTAKRCIPVIKRDDQWNGYWSLEKEDYFETDPRGERVPNSIVITITPEFAWDLFAKTNFKNRKVDWGKVKKYIDIMKNEKWYNTHQGMAFYDDGSLADGQHRLLAIGYAGIPVTVSVSSGIIVEASYGIDQGKKRTTGDVAKINGYDNFSRSMIKTASWLTSKKISQKGTERSPEEQIEFCDKHQEAILESERTDSHAVIRAAFAGCYEFSLGTKHYDKYNDGDSKSRLIELQSILRGEIRDNNPINNSALLVWQKGLNTHAKRAYSSGNNQASGYYKTEKAFDYFMRREPLKRLTISKSDRIERFPLPEDIAEITSQIE